MKFTVGLTCEYGSPPAVDCLTINANSADAAVAYCTSISATRYWGDTWKPVAIPFLGCRTPKPSGDGAGGNCTSLDPK